MTTLSRAIALLTIEVVKSRPTIEEQASNAQKGYSYLKVTRGSKSSLIPKLDNRMVKQTAGRFI